MDRAILHNADFWSRFAQVPSPVLRFPKIKPNVKLVYCLLIDFARQDSQCFPSQDTLSECCGLKKRQLITVLQRIQKEKLIYIERRGLNRPNVYHLLDVFAERPDIQAHWLDMQKNAHPGVRKTTLPAVQKNAPQKVQETATYKEASNKESNTKKQHPLFITFLKSVVEPINAARIKDRSKKPLSAKSIQEGFECWLAGERLPENFN